MKKFDLALMKMNEGILGDDENIGDDSTYDYTQSEEDQLPESVKTMLLEIEEELEEFNNPFAVEFRKLLTKYKIF